MAIAVIIVNVLVAAFNFYLAWKLWKRRDAIARFTSALIIAERNTHNVLSRAPQFVFNGQQGTKTLRERYQCLQIQLQQARQIFNLLLWLSHLGRTNLPSRTRSPKAFSRIC